jgi:hypothetical protein
MRTIALLPLALIACGPPSYEVRNESARPLPANVDAYVESAVAWWGADTSALDGWTIVVRDNPALCGVYGNAPAIGCTTWHTKTIEVQIFTAVCVVDALPALGHEIGHAVLGPPSGRHEDPRWPDDDARLAEIAAEVCAP